MLLTVSGMSRRTLIGTLILGIILSGIQKEAKATLKLSETNYLNIAKSFLGTTGRPNIFTRWYADVVKDQAFQYGSWCAMFLSYCSYKAGLLPITGSFAYTPYWVEWFKKHNQWGKTPKVGALVFYDWNGSGYPQHVGVVQAYNGHGLMYTIEGNKSNSVQRVHRDMKYVLGFGYPKYPGDPKEVKVTPTPAPKPKPKPAPKPKTYTVKDGDTLAGISREFYNTPDRWKDIYDKNKKVIGKDPNLIKPGMKLVIP